MTMCDFADLFRYGSRYVSPEAYRAEFENDLPHLQAEGVMLSLPLGGVGAVNARLKACAGGPDAP